MRAEDDVLVAVVVEVGERDARDLAHDAAADRVERLVARERRRGGVAVQPHLQRALSGGRALRADDDVRHVAAAAVQCGHGLHVAVVLRPVVLAGAVGGRQVALVVARALREPHEEVAAGRELGAGHEVRAQRVGVLVQRVHGHRDHRVRREARVVGRAVEQRRAGVAVEPHRDVVGPAGVGAQDQVLIRARVLRLVAVPVLFDQVRRRERQHAARRQRDDLEARHAEVLAGERLARLQPHVRNRGARGGEVARGRRGVHGPRVGVRRVVDRRDDVVVARCVRIGVTRDIQAAVLGHAHPDAVDAGVRAVEDAVAIGVGEDLALDVPDELLMQAERERPGAAIGHGAGLGIAGRHLHGVRVVAGHAITADAGEQHRLPVRVRVGGRRAGRAGRDRELDARQRRLARIQHAIRVGVIVRVDGHVAAHPRGVCKRPRQRGIRDREVECVRRGE